MKDYEEVAQDVFRRRDEYLEKMAKRRKIVKKAVVTFSCFCVVAAGGIFAWQNGLVGSMETESDLSGNDVFLYGELPTEGAICLLEEDYVSMTKEELIGYYGIDVFPETPQDLIEENRSFGIYRRDGGTGEVYWDQFTIHYTKEDHSRNITLEVAKGNLPLQDEIYSCDMETSIICGAEVKIGIYNEDCYYVEMLYENVGFVMNIYGLTKEEVISVITSIVQ